MDGIIGLYPEVEPFETGILRRPGGANIYYELSGARDGMPVSFLHGGPGSGAGPLARRYFDPEKHMIIIFDQRGAGRSSPKAELAGNTTQALVGDLQALRLHLGVGTLGLAGTSWGTTLALAYAEAYPDAVSFLALTGVFLGTEGEIAWWYGATGVNRFFPEQYERFISAVPSKARGHWKTVVEEYLTLMASTGERKEFDAIPFEKAGANLSLLRRSALFRWTEFETSMSYLDISEQAVADSILAKGPDYLRAHSLFEAYYFANQCFLQPEELMNKLGRIMQIPTHIVQSAYDMVCPPETAYRLHKNLPKSRFTLVSRSGHALNRESYKPLTDAIRSLSQEARRC